MNVVQLWLLYSVLAWRAKLWCFRRKSDFVCVIFVLKPTNHACYSTLTSCIWFSSIEAWRTTKTKFDRSKQTRYTVFGNTWEHAKKVEMNDCLNVAKPFLSRELQCFGKLLLNLDCLFIIHSWHFLRQPGFVLKAREVSTNKKVFINICQSETIQQATSTDGVHKKKKGERWSIPYTLTPPRDDLDKGI